MIALQIILAVLVLLFGWAALANLSARDIGAFVADLVICGVLLFAAISL